MVPLVYKLSMVPLVYKLSIVPFVDQKQVFLVKFIPLCLKHIIKNKMYVYSVEHNNVFYCTGGKPVAAVTAIIRPMLHKT
jgi:hypothetical protein